MPRNSCHAYLLRSLIRCAVCGLSFCGTWARTAPRYRCNGSMAQRGQFAGKCIGASIKGEKLEDVVWSDVSRFLSDPQDLVDELLADSDDAQTSAPGCSRGRTRTPCSPIAPPHRIAASALSTSTPAPSSPRSSSTPLPPMWNRNSRLWMSDWPRSNLPMTRLTTPFSEDTAIAEIRERLDGGPLRTPSGSEIVQLLVRRITVHTTLPEPRPQAGPRRYRLPLPASR